MNETTTAPQQAESKSGTAKLAHILATLEALRQFYKDELGESINGSIEQSIKYANELTPDIINAEVERKMKAKTQEQGKE